MAAKERDTAPNLSALEALAADPTRYHVFKALRIIEASFPNNPRLGRSIRPSQDAVRLHQEPELAFPPSTVNDFTPPDPEEGTPARLTNRFFGLWGPHGPMPLHLTEHARDRMRNSRDPTLVAFANVFHHRMTSLLYRAWAQAEPAPSYDRDDDDPFADKVAAVAGLKGDHLLKRDALPDMLKLRFSGRLSHGTRNEEGLLAMVSSFFRAPVSIESFVGSWLQLDPKEQFSMPAGTPTNRLGRSISVGERVWSRQAKFRFRIGPLSLAAYERLLPGGASLSRLAAIVRNYAGDGLDWDVDLVLRADEVPRPRLGRQGELGWTIWIGQRPEGVDADDLVVAPQFDGPPRDGPAETGKKGS
ncbi:MAG: type VI secretion system baseplate subunit TssG [Pseudomonadota bacterium]